MGYSRNPDTLKLILPQLRPLEDGRPVTWTVNQGQAEKWAYKVREGLSIAARFPHSFPLLARVARRFVIEVISETQVQARVTDQPILDVPQQGIARAHSPAVPLSVVGVSTARQIIQHYISSRPTNDTLDYPDADLSDEDRQLLVTWASKLQPRRIVIESGGSIRLQLATPDQPWSLLEAKAQPSEGEGGGEVGG